ncbi:MAG: ATP-binding cassette domain-containing protein [Armatimonadetes bacterium]|nr:ATP-binding cassette domain-containing protein [Armatimonadota bacterium]
MISVQHLAKSFGDVHVLKDVNAEIAKGEVISIIGPSGTGKSTFLRCLNLLDQPTGGRIVIDGQDLLARGADVPAIRRRMGMVFQSFNLFAHLTVMENLTIGPVKLLGRSTVDAKKAGMELLRMVGLTEKAHAFPDELSGGQKQRVAIARCLSMDPEIILFDEPTSALDPTMVSEVLAVIRKLAKQGMTMAIVTHEMDFARDVSSRVFYMDEGIIYEEGPSEVIFGAPVREKTRDFIGKVRSLGFHIANGDYDLYEIHGKIAGFCEKHIVPAKTTAVAQLLTEELLSVHIAQPGPADIDLSVHYSEKLAAVELRVVSSGPEGNPLVTAKVPDTLGLDLIRSFSKDIVYTREGERNKLSLHLT